MTPELGHAARRLAADRFGDVSEPRELAERAVHAYQQLATHLARLIGDAGVQLLLKRSVVLASKQLPWLVGGPPSASSLSGLRTALEQQDRESITEAFIAVLSAFVGLLERLIGEGLVERLLGEVWPTVFANAAKDTL